MYKRQGSCIVTATRAATAVYAAATSNPVSVPVEVTPQQPLILSAGSASINVAGSTTLSTSGGSGGGTVTYGVNDGPCTVSVSTLTGTGPGACHVTATKAAEGAWGAATSNTITVTVSLAPQAALVLTATPASITTTGTSTLGTTGGSGTGAVTYAVTSGACTVVVTSLGATVSGSCTVTATKAADASYGPATSNAVTVNVGLAPQSALVLTASPGSVKVGEASVLGTTGGDGTGAVAYTVASGPCTVVGNALTGTVTGSCTVTATKAATSTYQAVTSGPVTVTVIAATQAPLVLTATPGSISVNASSALSTRGGSGTGAVTHALVSGPCTLSGSTLTGTAQGTCQVTATKAGDGSYGPSITNPVTVPVTLRTPPALVLTATPTSVGFGGSSVLATSGGIPGAPVSYGVTGPCYVEGGSLLGTSGGACVVVATQAETPAYGAATSNPVAVTVKERTTVFEYPHAIASVGQPFLLAPVTSGFTKPTFAVLYGNLPAGLRLDPATGVISGTPAGPAGTFDAVVTAYENNAYDAALVVIEVRGEAEIPTLSEWGLAILALGLALAGMRLARGGA